VARQVVIEIQAKSSQVTGAISEVQAKLDQIKQGFRETGDAVNQGMGKAESAVQTLSQTIEGSLQTAIDKTFSDLVQSVDQGLQSFSGMEASVEDLARRMLRRPPDTASGTPFTDCLKEVPTLT